MITAPAEWQVEQGATVLAEFSVETRGDFVTRIEFEGLPPGVTALAAPTSRSTTQWRTEISADWGVPAGTHPVQIVALHGSATSRAPVVLAISEAPPLTVRLVPPDEAWGARTVQVELEVDGPGASKAGFLVDGVGVALVPPPFKATLDVSHLIEGRHELTAYVVRGLRWFDAEGATVLNVDRTAPRWNSRIPAGDDRSVSVRTEVLQVSYSEPVVLTGVPPVWVSSPPGLRLENLRVGQMGKSPHIVYADLVGAAPGMQVQVTIDGVVDRAGNPANRSSWMWTYTHWERLDAAPLNPAGVYPIAPKLLSNAAGDVFASWCTGQEVRLLQVTGWGWEALGAPQPGQSFDATIDPNGRPLLALPTKTISWDGTGWVDLGSTSAALGSPANWDFKIGSDHLGQPIVAAVADESGGKALRVARLGAGGWSRIFDDVGPGTAIRRAIFVGAPAGGSATHAAFLDDGEVRWFAWDAATGWASAFTPVTGIDPTFLAAAHDPAGNPVMIGRQSVAGGHQPLLLLWSGQGWIDVGPALAATEAPSGPWWFSGVDIEWSPASELYAAWSFYGPSGAKVLVSRWDGATWSTVGGQPVAEGPGSLAPSSPTLAFSGADLYVLWRTGLVENLRLEAARYMP